MFTKWSNVGEKIDVEQFVKAFLSEDSPSCAIVMNDLFFEETSIDVIIEQFKKLSDRHNLGLEVKVYNRGEDRYFVFVHIEKV